MGYRQAVEIPPNHGDSKSPEQYSTIGIPMEYCSFNHGDSKSWGFPIQTEGQLCFDPIFNPISRVEEPLAMFPDHCDVRVCWITMVRGTEGFPGSLKPVVIAGCGIETCWTVYHEHAGLDQGSEKYLIDKLHFQWLCQSTRGHHSLPLDTHLFTMSRCA